MTAVTKVAVALGVIALAIIVALLPRESSQPEAVGPDLSAARAQAQLMSCALGDDSSSEAGVPVLAGVTAPCLGDGTTADLGKALAGRTVVINFWATWCAPCTEELPVLAAYASQPEAVDVVTVQVASSASDGLDLLTRLGVHLPAFHDGDGQSGPIRTALKVPQSLPASYLLQRDGSIRLIERPRVFTGVDQVRNAVAGTS